MTLEELIDIVLPHAVGAGQPGDHLCYENEIKTTLRGGCCICSPDDGDYVRFTTPNGYELMYWTSTEWQEEPQSCMGAILGLMNVLSDLKPEQINQLEAQIKAGIES